MNIFSNIGITELILILLLALLVVGPERLPEVARGIAKTLRDVRRMYDNLTRELGPELQSLQESTREIRESVEAVRSIPKDAATSVIKAADLDDTVAELRGIQGDLGQVGKTVSEVQRIVRHPGRAATDLARTTLTGAVQAAADETQAPAPTNETAQAIEPVATDETAPVPPELPALDDSETDGQPQDPTHE